MSETPVRFMLDFAVARGDSFHCSICLRTDQRVIALVGESGIGKTTLLHAIAGLTRPSAGRIEIAGRCLFDRTTGVDVPAHRRRIGYVFQDARLFPHLDVRSNLLFGTRGDRPAGQGFGFDDIVELLGISALLARATTDLSGGEKQRVAIGRALLCQPRVLLLDEPLSMLDLGRRDELLPYLQRLRDETSLPMIYVSHNPEEVARIAGEVHRIGPRGH